MSAKTLIRLIHKNDFSPLSGYEKKYEPSKWNNNSRIKQNQKEEKN